MEKLQEFFHKFDLFYTRVTDVRELRSIFNLDSFGLKEEHMEAICTANGDRAKIRKNHCTFDFLIEQIRNHQKCPYSWKDISNFDWPTSSLYEQQYMKYMQSPSSQEFINVLMRSEKMTG